MNRRARILAALRDGPLTAYALTESLDGNRSATNAALLRLRHQGRVRLEWDAVCWKWHLLPGWQGE